MGRLATMFSDVVGSMFRRPATESYPLVRTDAPPRLRGMLHVDLQACTGCGLCAMDCPARAIQVTMLDRKAKRFVYNYHVDRCAFCGQCLQSCKQGALSMCSDEWELAQLDRTPFWVRLGDPKDVAEVLAGTPEGGTAERNQS